MSEDPDDKCETWTLRIRTVQMRDEGKYECQVNAKPERSYFVYLRVVGESCNRNKSINC